MQNLLEIIEAYEAETEKLARRKGTKRAVASRRLVAANARAELNRLPDAEGNQWREKIPAKTFALFYALGSE